MVLLAMCDTTYCFTFFNFGSYGSNNDCAILSNLAMGEAFEYNEIDLTEPTRSYKNVVMILCLLYFRR